MSEYGGVVAQMKKYGRLIAIAKGDLYPSIHLLLPYMQLYNENGEELKGYEEKGQRIMTRPRFFDSIRGPKEEKRPPQPNSAFFDPDGGKNMDNNYFSITAPQHFPTHFKTGRTVLAIGAGYDIMMEYCGTLPFTLNGSYEDPQTRYEVMRNELKKAGFVGESIGIKPVMLPIISHRKANIQTLDEMRKRSDVVVASELPRTMQDYMNQKDIKVYVHPAFSGADNDAGIWLFDVTADILETGGSLLDNIRSFRLVLDDDGNLAIMLYSIPWVLTTTDHYNRDPKFFDGVFAMTRNSRGVLGKEKPELFEERYAGFEERFTKREKELGLE